MKTSYKFWYVTKADDVHISEVAVRFYDGKITTENETIDANGTIAPVTRYRRTKRLNGDELSSKMVKKIKKEKTGDDCIIYTNKDFGVTADLDVVRAYLNIELAKDKSREPIDEQKVK